MTITLLALSALSAAPGGHAALHPSGAVVYVEASDVPAIRAAWDATALARLLADGDVHAAIGAALGVEAYDPRGALTETLAAPLGKAADAPTSAELLAGLVAGSFSIHAEDGGVPRYAEQAEKVAATEAGLVALSAAVHAHAAETGALPETLAELGERAPEAAEDPFGSPYAYARDGAGFTLSSYGLDGAPGGTGSGADVLLGGSTEAVLEALLFESFGFQVALELDSAETASRTFRTIAEHCERAFGDGLEREALALASGGEAAVLALPALPEGPLRIVHLGQHLLVLGGALAPEELGQRLAGAGASLAGHAALSAGKDHFESAGVVALEGFSTLGADFLTLVEPPALTTFIDVFDALLGTPIAMLAGGGHWRISIDDGRFVTQGFHAPVAGNAVGGAPLGEESFGLVHPDALCAWLASVDLPRITAGLMTLGGDAGEVETALAKLDAEHGFRPDRDLIAPLGSTMACSLPPLRTLMSAPDVQLAFQLDDRETFVRGMDGLTALLLAELGGEVAAEAVDYRDARIYTFSFKNLGAGAQGLPFDPSAFVRPTVVVLADRVFLTTLPNHGKREVRRLKKGEAGAHPKVVKGLVPEGATELVFADWATFFGKVYTSARLMAPMLAMGGGELPFDPNALPAAEVFTSFFAPSVRYERRVDGGVLHKSVSSFGPDLPVVLVGAGWLGWRGVMGQMADERVETIEATLEATPGEPAPEDRALREAREATLSELKRLKVAVQVYRFDKDAYPAALADLEGATTAYPKGFLDGGAVPKDAWGHDFEYALVDGGYRLHSVGPDGVDQGGAGDDVQAD